MVVQGINDRSKIREHIVIEKQGFRDEGETREGKPGEDPEMGVHGKRRRSGEDPGKIHRSVWGSVFRSVSGEGNKRTRMEGQGDQRETGDGYWGREMTSGESNGC